jgi:tRNA A37 threonylcarbamoyladenosine modification protein TsaB
MIASIDTSELHKVRLRLDDKGKTRRVSFAIYADAALPKLAKLLHGSKPQAIGVVVGPGAFSATRTGVALANALAYAWGIPLIPLDRTQFEELVTLPHGRRTPAAVVYGALPNITKRSKPLGMLGAAKAKR